MKDEPDDHAHRHSIDLMRPAQRLLGQIVLWAAPILVLAVAGVLWEVLTTLGDLRRDVAELRGVLEAKASAREVAELAVRVIDSREDTRDLTKKVAALCARSRCP